MNTVISSFMKSPVVTVKPDIKLIEVIKLMRLKSVGSVLIIQKNKLKGIFTDKDVIKHVSQPINKNLIKPITQFMTPDPVCIQARDTAGLAYNLMKQYKIRHLPVFDGNILSGIISMRDLIEQIQQPLEAESEHIVKTEAEVTQKARELTGFQIRNISFLAHLYMHDAVDDEIVENLRESELEYFALIEKCRYLEQRVNIDEKTGLLKYKSDYLLAILKTASRVLSGFIKNYPVCFIRFDIDDFSVFNNRYGHDIGDQVLVRFSQLLKDNSRPTDYVIRFGGEEFDIILPNTNREGMICLLKKLYHILKSLTITIDGNPILITVSAGATNLIYSLKNRIIDDSSIQALFTKLQNEADNALYDSKYGGKNRFSLYDADKNGLYAELRTRYAASKK